jgi:VanZ family protein
MRKAFGVTMVWAAFIAALTLMPQSEFENNALDGLDKAVHLFLYAVLSLCFIIGSIRFKRYSVFNKYPIYSALAVCFLYGVLLEILQGTVFVSRSFELADVLANTIGVLIGISGFMLIYGKPENYTCHASKKGTFR